MRARAGIKRAPRRRVEGRTFLPEGIPNLPPERDPVEERRLVASVEGIVAYWATRYEARLPSRSPLERSDLDAAGRIGALIAARRFDRGRGCRFSTPAWHWIRRMVQRRFHRDSLTVRRPRRHFGPRSFVGGKAAVRLDAPLFTVNDGDEAGSRVPMLVGASLADKTPSAEDHLLVEATRAEVQAVLAKLKPRTRDVLLSRAAGEPMEDIGERWGITYERVRQLYVKGAARFALLWERARSKDA